MEKDEIKKIKDEIDEIYIEKKKIDDKYSLLLAKKDELLKKTNMNISKFYNFVWIFSMLLLLKPVFINNLDWLLQLSLYLVAAGYGKLITVLAREITIGKVENYKIKHNDELKEVEDKMIELYQQFKQLDQKQSEKEEIIQTLISNSEKKLPNSYEFNPDEVRDVESINALNITKGKTRKLINNETTEK